MITQTYQVWRCTWCGMAALQPEDFSANDWTHRCSPSEGARMEVVGFLAVQLGPIAVAPPLAEPFSSGDLVGVANIIADCSRYRSAEDCARAALACAIRDGLVEYR